MNPFSHGWLQYVCVVLCAVMLFACETPLSFSNINTQTVKLVAEAGRHQVLWTTGLVELHAIHSNEQLDQNLSYHWQLITKPETSAAYLTQPDHISSLLHADVMGTYVVLLTVSNQDGEKAQDIIVISEHGRGLQCADCHDGENAKGDFTHPDTVVDGAAACSYCHGPSKWQYSLKQVRDTSSLHAYVSDRCASCHHEDYVKAKQHMTSSLLCQNCHNKSAWTPALSLEHPTAMGKCANCHSLESVDGVPQNHPSTEKDCGFCHDRNGWQSRAAQAHQWTNHICIDCHDTPYDIENQLHINFHQGFSAACSNCHYSMDPESLNWQIYILNHSEYFDFCDACHEQSGFHLPTSQTCAACHQTSVFIPVINFDHTQALGTCIKCHNPSTGYTSKPAKHLVTNQPCDYCHIGTTAWKID